MARVRQLIWVLLLCSMTLGLPASAQQMTASARVDAQLQAMTTREKVTQMFMVSFYGRPLNEPARNLLQTWQPGGVVLLPSNLGTPEQVTALTNEIQSTLTIPALIAVDQEGGLIAHLEEGFTEFPVPSLLTATQDTQLAEAFGAALAQELRAVGINVNLAPVADLYTNPDNPIIGRRSFGSDPQQVAPIIAGVVRGMQSGDVMAVVKHFPGHGDTDDDSHTTLPILLDTSQELMSRELVPFRRAIAADVGAVMVSHIYFPAIESTPDTPASLSRTIITGLLRRQMQHEGIIITDAMDMDAIDTRYTPEEAAIAAIQAGNDMLIRGAHVSPQSHAAVMQAVLDAVERGDIPEARIDASVRRILQAKQHFNVLDWQPLDPATAPQRIDAESHLQLVDELFRKGITLVEGTLPPTGEVAVVYPGTRFSLWRECELANWQGVGVAETPSSEDIARARNAAVNADSVVVFTQNAGRNLQQQALVEALPPDKTLVVALWSPDDWRFLPQTSGYLVTYSPLLRSHDELCAILQGQAPAQGVFSMRLDTYPQRANAP